MKPSVSAVIPVYQGEAYLAQAIRSVLEQTHEPIECIVVDDGSTDASGEIARGFGSEVSYLSQPKTGVSAARNRGASVAKGDYLGFLDHDDVWLPRRCERMLDALVSSTASMAVCAVSEVDEELNPVRISRQETQQDLLERILVSGANTVSCSSAALVPRSSFFQLGGFDESFGTSADWEFMMRNLLEGQVEYLDEPLVLYRHHGQNWTRRVDEMEMDMVRAFEKVFANPHLPAAVKRKERRAYARLYRNLAGLYLESGERWAAARSLAASLRSYPPGAHDLIRSVGRRFQAAGRAAAGGSR